MSSIQIRPLSGACGAVLYGVDLSRDLDNNVVAEIRQALLTYLVIFFRDQILTREQHKALGRRFGTLNVHSQYVNLEDYPEILPVLKESNVSGKIGGVWHSDMTHLAEPPLGSILYAKDVPAVGGDTMFANQYLAYETLSDAMKTLLDSMKVVHSSRRLTDRDNVERQNAMRSSKLRDDIHPVEDHIDNLHPVVRPHPETGRKALFVNSAFTAGFDGMTEAESVPFLGVLYAHSARHQISKLEVNDKGCTLRA